LLSSLSLLSSCSADGTLGVASEALCHGGFAIANVQIDPTTIHGDDPHQLLTSAEGCGPRTLDLNVATSISPSISYTSTFTPTDSQLSTALGYSVSTSIILAADSSVLVPINAYARVDAYPTFQRATFQIVGQNCPGTIVVGTGSALKPVGVYFETCGLIGTDPCGVSCVGGKPAAPSQSSSSPGNEPPSVAETGADGGADGG
jgi:hypothetical protein